MTEQDKNQPKRLVLAPLEPGSSTRFETLKRYAAANDHRWSLYRTSCRNLAHLLHRAMQEYLECGVNDIKYVPTIGEYDPSKGYTVTGALRMGEDSFFHIGLHLTLGDQQVLIPFKIKKIPDTQYDDVVLGEHVLKVGNYDKEFRLNSSEWEKYTPVCEYVFEMIKEDLDMSLDRWLEQDESEEQPSYAIYPPYPPQDATHVATRPHESLEVYSLGREAEPSWINTQEAAEISGYHPEYVRRLARQGKIDAMRKGRDWWIDRRSLQEYLDAIDALGTQKYTPKRPMPPDMES